MLRRVIAIVGPTATGKSAAAMTLARELGGEIVNADSRQVYRGMDIGTAKPSFDDRRAVRHHLYDIANPADSYSLALYVRDARAAFEDCWRRGTFPWLVGGTGQYIWALLEGWNVPEVPPDVELRADLARRADAHGPASLHARLAEVDPIAASRIDPNNTRRVIRALEVHHHTGIPISEWQTRSDPGFEYLLFGMDLPNDVLEPRIEARVREMFATGLVEEVRALLDSGLDASAPAMSSIGYREAARHIAGELTLEAAIEETARATRRLVRRQRQWFRKDDSRIRWVDGPASIELEANIFTGACTNVLRGSSRW